METPFASRGRRLRFSGGLLLVAAFLLPWNAGGMGDGSVPVNALQRLVEDVAQNVQRGVTGGPFRVDQWVEATAGILSLVIPLAVAAATAAAMALRRSWERALASGAVLVTYPAVLLGLPVHALVVLGGHLDAVSAGALVFHGGAAAVLVGAILASVRRRRPPALLLQAAAYAVWTGGLAAYVVGAALSYGSRWIPGIGFAAGAAGCALLFAGTSAAFQANVHEEGTLRGRLRAGPRPAESEERRAEIG